MVCRGTRLLPFSSCSVGIGDTFRSEPNGVIFNSATAYNAIYNNRANVRKSRFYEAWNRNSRAVNIFTSVDRAAHSKKRKSATPVFSDRSVQSAEDFVIKHVDRWCDMMLDGDNQRWSAPRNMAEWCDYLTFDILGDLCFGRSFESTQPEGKHAREKLATINKYMTFMYPVRRCLESGDGCSWYSDC